MADQPGRIVVSRLSKRFGPVQAVQDLSFTVEPGSVTGFLLFGVEPLLAVIPWIRDHLYKFLPGGAANALT